MAAWEADLTTMPFGDHRGKPIDQVETKYLQWWMKKMDSDNLRVEYRDSVARILLERGDAPPRPSMATNGLASARLIFAAGTRQMIKAWFGRMTLRYHPDRGGTDEAQRVVNDCYKELMTELAKWEVER